MRTKYANPYFKNEEMHSKLLEYINQKKPVLSPNPNINQYEEDQLPVPESTSKSQAGWIKKSPSPNRQSTTNQQNYQSLLQQQSSVLSGGEGSIRDSFAANSRNKDNVTHAMLELPFAKDKLGSIDGSYITIEEAVNCQLPDDDLYGMRSPSMTANAGVPRPSPMKDQRLNLNLTEMTQTHYATTMSSHTGGRKFLDDIGSADLRNRTTQGGERISDSVQLDGGYSTLTPKPALTTMDQQSCFEKSRFISQERVDPNSLLPPYSLTVREKAEKLKKELQFPQSPAFVNIYKMMNSTDLMTA